VSERYVPNDEVRRIRQAIDHPVIDSDAHTIEYLPDVRERLRSIGGADVVRRFDRHYRTMDHGHEVPAPLRRRYGISRPPWWTYPTRNTLDRATATFPALLRERLPEIGIDFIVVYPSYFIQFPMAADEDFRRAGCRAVNSYLADTFSGLESQMTPAAAIPMHTPEEAIDELVHVTRDLGLRAAVFAGVVLRQVPGTERVWVDSFGLDSAYDYEPVWQFCEDNGVAVTFHSAGMGWGSRAGLSNFMENHLGHFAAAGESVARSLLFAGVPVRHPRLRFAFLEGGAAWGASLYGGLVEHFGKRSGDAIRHYDPREIDVPLMRRLLEENGTASMRRHADQLEQSLQPLNPVFDPIPDEFASTGFTSADHIREVFERSYFFGVEGDDPMNAVATERFSRHLGTRINAIYSSDIGHWDVRDMRDVLHEAYELVDDGAASPADFRRTVFEAPVRLWTGGNPRFFDGTVIEKAVRELTAGDRPEAAPPVTGPVTGPITELVTEGMGRA
jgi:predicted TIM-barrel fold metal-dependent hydrolase